MAGLLAPHPVVQQIDSSYHTVMRCMAPGGCQSFGLRAWDLIDISLLGDIWSGNHIRTFKDLQIRYSLHNTQFYRYLQLRHALQSHITDGSSLPEYRPSEAQTLTGNLGKGGISCIYHSLVNNTPNALSRLRDKWEGWLGSLDDTDWRDALMAPGRSQPQRDSVLCKYTISMQSTLRHYAFSVQD